MQYGLGIDLGTTQTAAAVRADGRIEVVRLGGRRAEIPSLVFVRPDGSLLIGEAAERRGQAEPARLAREFKRRIGDPVPILAGGVPFSAHALTAKLLRYVLDEVTKLQGGPPSVLTVTHPANWGPYKREQLDQALRLADTGPVLLRTEPEAAALQHATARKIGPGATVAVYDLGGGTFDAAVLRREGEGFLLLGEPEGIEQLGGADFDEAVFGHVLGVLGSRVGDLDPNEPDVVTALARLRRDCVEAKEALSFDTEVMIPVALPGVHTRVRLNRSELESMIAPALADTVATMHRALRAAGVTADQLDGILLAGGSSRIPLVSQLLATAFGRPVVADPHPEHSIAMGAAVSTALITGGASPFAAAAAPIAESEAVPGSPAHGPKTTDGRPETPAGPVTAAESGSVGGAESVAGTGAVAGVVDGALSSAETAASGVVPGVAADRTPAQRGDTTSVGAARVPADAPAGRPVNGVPVRATSAGEASTRVAARIVDDSRPTQLVPGGGGTVHGSALPVAYSRGAASVPSPAGQAAPPFAPGPPVTTSEPHPKRSGRKLLLVGVVTLAVIAGTSVLVALNLGGGGDGEQAREPASPPPASPSVSASPFPTDTMLVRVDTGGDARPERKSAVSLLTPGRDGRTSISDTGRDVLPAWSRDRRRFALTRYQKDGSHTVWVMDADGKNSEKVLENVTDGRVTWSKDGKRLAFMRETGGTPQIFVITIGESRATQLTRASGKKDDPAWSPDGESIAYWAYVGKQRQIFVLRVDDPDEPGRQITDGANGPGVDPAWSPDGSRIAYTHGTGKDVSDIWVIGSDGSGAAPLTEHESREMDPSWSPDGSWLAFTRGKLEKPTIVIVKADGSEEKTLTRGEAREGHPCWS